MGSDKKKEKSGWYRFGSGLLWSGGQFAYNWFIVELLPVPKPDFWQTIGAIASAFIAGWTTAAFLGKFANWGAGYKTMMVLGILLGVAVFSGAFSGLTSLKKWIDTKDFVFDWQKLQDFVLSWSVAPPAGLGLLTGIYVRAKIPRPKEKK